MKIIFLDIDGVLNVYPQGRDKYGPKFHSNFVENLKEIINKTNAKIVISSSWKSDGLDILKSMWRYRNLPGEIIDITPDLYFIYSEKEDDSYCRGDEIQLWLDKHPEIVNYVIIDDDDDMLQTQMNNFVRTSKNIKHPDCVDIGYGLTKICAEKSIKILINGKNT